MKDHREMGTQSEWKEMSLRVNCTGDQTQTLANSEICSGLTTKMKQILNNTFSQN